MYQCCHRAAVGHQIGAGTISWISDFWTLIGLVEVSSIPSNVNDLQSDQAEELWYRVSERTLLTAFLMHQLPKWEKYIFLYTWGYSLTKVPFANIEEERLVQYGLLPPGGSLNVWALMFVLYTKKCNDAKDNYLDFRVVVFSPSTT